MKMQIPTRKPRTKIFHTFPFAELVSSTGATPAAPSGPVPMGSIEEIPGSPLARLNPAMSLELRKNCVRTSPKPSVTRAGSHRGAQGRSTDDAQERAECPAMRRAIQVDVGSGAGGTERLVEVPRS
jgi:hypothetical protein